MPIDWEAMLVEEQAKKFRQPKNQYLSSAAEGFATGVGKGIEAKFKSAAEQQVLERENFGKFALDLFSKYKPLKINPDGTTTPLDASEHINLANTILQRKAIPPGITFTPLREELEKAKPEKPEKPEKVSEEPIGLKYKQNEVLGALQKVYSGDEYGIWTQEEAKAYSNQQGINPDDPGNRTYDPRIAAEIRRFPTESEFESKILPQVDPGVSLPRTKKRENEVRRTKYDQLDRLIKEWKTGKSKQQIQKKPIPTTPAKPPAPATQTYNFNSVEEAERANLPKGTVIYIQGRKAIVE